MLYLVDHLAPKCHILIIPTFVLKYLEVLGFLPHMHHLSLYNKLKIQNRKSLIAIVVHTQEHNQSLTKGHHLTQQHKSKHEIGWTFIW